MPKRGKSRQYALEWPQVQKLLSSLSDLEECFLIKGQIFLGLRVSELAHVNANWLKADGNSLQVPSVQKCDCAVCQNHPKHPREWMPKTKAGARVLPLPNSAKNDILEYLRQRPNGLEISRVTIWEKTKAILKRAGIRTKGLAGNVAYPHALRATFGSLLAESGIDARALAYAFGHGSTKVADEYVEVARARKSADKQIREIFG